jgi:hypothetical protein
MMVSLMICYDTKHATIIGATANLFRRNSIAPKMLSLFAFGVGHRHLTTILDPLMRKMMESNTINYEVYSHSI